jgi:hypothetical protein
LSPAPAPVEADRALIGTPGDDQLQGGAGSDRIHADQGDDTLMGGAGNNQLWAGAGNDSLSTGAGDDLLAAGQGNDSLLSAAGHDILLAGAGDDQLDAGQGNDFLDAGLGNDSLITGDGHDLIAAGAGDDSIQLGQGSKVILFNRGDGQDSVAGLSNQDIVLSLGHQISADEVQLRQNGADLIISLSQNPQLGQNQDEHIALKNWYASGAANAPGQRPASLTVQFIQALSANQGNQATAPRAQAFDLLALINAYEAQRSAEAGAPSTNTWQPNTAQWQSALIGQSDNLAFGGPIAWRYGRYNTPQSTEQIGGAQYGYLDWSNLQQDMRQHGIDAPRKAPTGLGSAAEPVELPIQGLMPFNMPVPLRLTENGFAPLVNPWAAMQAGTDLWNRQPNIAQPLLRPASTGASGLEHSGMLSTGANDASSTSLSWAGKLERRQG